MHDEPKKREIDTKAKRYNTVEPRRVSRGLRSRSLHVPAAERLVRPGLGDHREGKENKDRGIRGADS